jgi:uncharacterized membrane protein YeaQ/YmgE (transglycosylase-associated protein family)
VTKPTTAMEPAASQAFREQSVPSVTNVAPTRASARNAANRVRQEPSNSTSTSIANDPKAANSDTWGCSTTLSANAKTAGITIAARAAFLNAVTSTGKRSYDGPERGAEHVGAQCSGTFPRVAVIAILVLIILVLLLAGALVGLAFELLGLVLTGLIVGALGRLVLPGRQQIGLLQTSLIGIAAGLLGGVLGDIFDVNWLVRFLVAVALAAIGVTLVQSRSGSESARTPV